MQQTIPIRELELARQRYIAEQLKQAFCLGWKSFQGAWKAVIKFHTYDNPSMQAEFERGREHAKERKVLQATDAPEKRGFIYRTDERASA